MTDAMIEAARANAERAGFDQVEVRKGLIEELPLDADEADWVISNCVINLSPEKERVFAEVHRVLKPGGRFSISDIVVEELPEALRSHAAAYAACVAGAIPEAQYVAGLRAAGLLDVEVSERLVYSAVEIRGIVKFHSRAVPVISTAFREFDEVFLLGAPASRRHSQQEFTELANRAARRKAFPPSGSSPADRPGHLRSHTRGSG